MITGLEGALAAVGPDWADVTVGGVTIRASIPESASGALGATGERVRLFTSLQVRDDSLTLYGFPSEDARTAFEALIGVNGVGPRLALSILSTMTTDALALAIDSADPGAFKGVSGVGTKTANRIVLELKGKLDWQPVASVHAPAAGHSDLVDALTALGYTVQEASAAVSALPEDAPDSLEERLRIALQDAAG